MSASDLPGANLSAPVGNDDLFFDQQVYKAEFLERMRLVFGNPTYIAASSWGIVADADPTVIYTGIAYPWLVTASALTVTVAPGIAVTKSGHRIVVSKTVTGVQMAGTEDDVINVVAAKYALTTPTETSTSEYHSTVYRQRQIPTDENLVVTYTLAQWQALAADVQDDHVPLALSQVTVASDGSKSLTITHYSTSYTWLRPWFSPVDIRHRAMVGSGTPSTTNPHGLTFNELSIGDFTFPMITRRAGVVIAKESSMVGSPGTVCTTTIQPSQVLTDSGGSVTGVTGARYIVLPFYPIALGAVYSALTEFTFDLLAGTQIIYQPATTYQYAVPNPAPVLTVLATRATALEPPSSLTTNTTFAAGELASTEAVIASGKAYVSDSTMTLTDNMSDASHIPVSYRWYCVDGAVVKNPQVLLCRTKLTDFGTGITPSITPLGVGQALVALDGAAEGAALNVKVRITGTLADGTASYEVLTFGASWVSVTPPLSTTQTNQFQRGTKVWATVTSISLDENQNSGDPAAIQVWLAMDPTTATALSYACPIADAHWDGTKLISIIDLRPVVSELAYGPDIDPGLWAPTTATVVYGEPATATRDRVFAEDFRRQQLSSLVPVTYVNWYGYGIGIDSVLGRERTLDGLSGVYESRAMSVPTRAVCRLYLYPTRQQPPAPVVYWSGQHSGTGNWSAWSGVSATGNSIWVYNIPINIVTDSAVRFRIHGHGRGLRGYTVVTWSTPVP